MKKKLLVQVAVVISVLLVIELLFFMFVVFANTSMSYFAAVKEAMKNDLGVISHQFNLIKSNASAFDYLLDRGDDINIDEILSEMMDWMAGDDPDSKYNDVRPSAAECYDYDRFGELNEIEKEYYSVIFYDILRSMLRSRIGGFESDCIYIIAIDDKGNSEQVMKCLKIDGEGYTEETQVLGTEPDIDVARSVEIEKLCREKTDETRYEQVSFNIPENKDNSSQEKLYYAAYKLLASTPKRNYVVCSFHDNSELLSDLDDLMLPMLMVSVVLIITTDITLILFLRRKVTRPLSRIQQNVREYTNTKDTEHIVKEMSGIITNNEFGVLARDIEYMAEEMDRYNEENSKLAAERERTATELETAAKIQMSQLPREFPEYEEFQIYASMYPAKEVGGDFYDFFFKDDDHITFVIADVSGKGVPAALFMMASDMLIKSYSRFYRTPAEILGAVNDRICENNADNMFVTVWLGILEISTGKLTCCNAGHEEPVIRRADGKFELLKDKHGLFVGVKPGLKYKEYELRLEKGDTVFVYTDGVPEATNSELQLFGDERMTEALNSAPDGNLSELLQTVKSKVDEFVGEAPQFDDLTMLAIKYFGK